MRNENPHSEGYEFEALEMAESSARFLNRSAVLLQQVIRIAGSQTEAAVGFSMALSQLSKPSRFDDDSLYITPTDGRTKSTIAKARAVIRSAARATLDIDTLIGGRTPIIQPFARTPAPTFLTMLDIIKGLEKLERQAAFASVRWPGQRAEFKQILRGVQQMLEIANRHRDLALQSASAVNTLRHEASEFIRAMERTE